MRIACNSSGGKDSVLACYYATQKGFEVSTLINFMFTNYGKYTPIKISKYLTTNIGKSTPYRVSAMLSLGLRAIGRRLSSSLSNLKYSVSRIGKSNNAQKVRKRKVGLSPGRRLVPHEVPPELVALQAEAMGTPIIHKETTWERFDRQLKLTLRELDPKDIEGGVVWGMIPPDTVLDHPRKIKKANGLKGGINWIRKQSSEVGVKTIFPLLEKTPEQIMQACTQKGFEVIIVVVNPAFVGEEWLGRKIDQDFINFMEKLNKEKGVHLCGDEYHTFVLDCPLFKKRIEILQSRIVSRQGYSTLEISKAKLVPKEKNNIILAA